MSVNHNNKEIFRDAYISFNDFMRLMTMLTGRNSTKKSLKTAYNFCSQIFSEDRPYWEWSVFSCFWQGKSTQKLGNHPLSLIHFSYARALNNNTDFETEILMSYSYQKMWKQVVEYGEYWINDNKGNSEFKKLEIKLYVINALRNLRQTDRALTYLKECESQGHDVFPKDSEEYAGFLDVVKQLRSWLEKDYLFPTQPKLLDDLLKNQISLGIPYN